MGQKRATAGYRPRSRAGRPTVALPVLCRSLGLPEPVAEYRFHPERRWRFDWAFVEAKLAVEQEGAVWVNGRHTRGSGFVADMEKYNAAAALGWRIVRGTPQQIASGAIIPTIEQALKP